MDKEETVIDSATAKISLVWSVLSFEWVSALERLEPTWKDIFSQLGAILMLAAIAYAVLVKIMKKYDEYYLACHFDDRARSKKTGILVGTVIYVVGLAAVYGIGLGMPIFYSTVGLTVGIYMAFKIAKENAQSE